MAASATRRGNLDHRALREALAVANVPVLCLLLVQLTGEQRWIEAPYQPTRNAGLTDNASGGLAPERQQEVRAAALSAIERWQAGAAAALERPSLRLLVRMLGVSMGESVPAEYGPMIAAEVGALDQGVRAAPPPPPDFRALIVGAGICGIAAAVTLTRLGVAYEIVERNADVGGTWLENRYPGCGVDTPSAIYSFSFAPHAWGRHFASRDEVLAYLRHVAQEHAVTPNVSFGTELLAARYQPARQRWVAELRAADGSVERREANMLISAVGAFTRPRTPPIDGLDSFAGPCVHTARWPEQGLELSGLRVGVIGNGASAMQVVPALAESVSELNVFQRSPQWIAPFPYLHKELPRSLALLAVEVPLYGAWQRVRWSWTFNDRLYPALQKDPQWEHPERAVNAENDAHRRYFTRYLEAETSSRPELRAAITPTYPPFGKRILLDNGWFTAITRENVRLLTDPIARVEPAGIRCASGKLHELDAIVCATGFDVVSFLAPIELHGRSGESLRDAWDGDDARAYLGMTVPDFPNLFIMYGPNVQPGHGGSLFGLAEMQAHYIEDVLAQMFERRLGSVECRRAVWERYNERVESAHERMIWTHPGMETYYRNARGRVVVPGPFRVIDLWQMTRSARLAEYETEPLIPPVRSDAPAAR